MLGTSKDMDGALSSVRVVRVVRVIRVRYVWLFSRERKPGVRVPFYTVVKLCCGETACV